MTKSERLQELKIQDTVFKATDKVMDAGWSEFVKGIQKSNDLSNKRMFNILNEIKGGGFVNDLKKFMLGIKKEHSLIQLSKKPKGMALKDNRFPTIKEIWINQKQSGIYGDKPNGELYIQIKPDRWIYFNYTMF